MNTALASTAAVPMAQRILDVADALFYGDGIQAIGVNAIAARAGISKRTLYKYFPSKDDLVAAYLLRRAAPYGQESGEPLAQVLEVFDRLGRWFKDGQFRGCPFFNALAELSANAMHPAVAVAREFKESRRQWFEARFIELDVEDPTALADQFMILLEGTVATSLVRGGDPAVARSAGAVARVLLRAAGVKA